MADNVNITPGTGNIIAADEVTDGTLGTVKVQYVKIMDGTINGTNKASVGANGLVVDGSGVTQPISGTITTIPPANASTNLTQVGGAALSEGQALMAASIPVVIASDQSAISVTGTITTSPDVNIHDGSGNTIASTGTSLNVDVTNTVPVTGTFFQATQPISGTVTANAGTGTFAVSAVSLPLPTGASTSANQTNASQKTQIVDGSGNVIASTSNALNVDVTNFPATQPVSGTVTANIGTTGGLSLDTTQTNGNQKTQIVDGSGTVVGPDQTISGTNYLPVVLAASGATGSVVPARTIQVGGSDGTNLRSIKVSTTGVVSVDGSATTQPVSGTITANQGTSPWVTQASPALGVTIQTVGITASSNGDNTVIAAVSAKKIYVFAWNISFSGSVNAKFTDGAAGTLLSGLYYGVVNAGGGNAVSPPNYLWAGSTNTALVINLSSATAVGGSVSYFVI